MLVRHFATLIYMAGLLLLLVSSAACVKSTVKHVRKVREESPPDATKGVHSQYQYGELSTVYRNRFLALLGQLKKDEKVLADTASTIQKLEEEMQSIVREKEELVCRIRDAEQQQPIIASRNNALDEDKDHPSLPSASSSPELDSQERKARAMHDREALSKVKGKEQEKALEIDNMKMNAQFFGDATVTSLFLGLAEIGFQKSADYTVLERIGAGACCNVYRAKDRQGNMVAIKVFKLQRAQELFMNELRMHARLMSKAKDVGQYRQHIIQLRSVITDMHAFPAVSAFPALVFDYMEEDLQHFLKSDRGRKAAANPAFVKKLMRALLEACAFLERKNILHGDLKPNNVMISFQTESDFYICLIDLGLSKLLNRPFSSPSGPLYINTCRSAEVSMLGPVGFKADVYAIGEFFMDIWDLKEARKIDPMLVSMVQQMGLGEDALQFAHKMISRYGYRDCIDKFYSWTHPLLYKNLSFVQKMFRLFGIHVLKTDISKWTQLPLLFRLQRNLNKSQFSFYLYLTQTHPDNRPNAAKALSSAYFSKDSD